MSPTASPSLILPLTASASGLNAGQAEAVRQLDIWLESQHKWFLLEALPGRGKSFVIKYWLNKNSRIKPDVIITAPTHQALEELAQDIPGISAMTIHALLGYRPQSTETEKQILVRAGSGTSPKKIDYKIVIVEEGFYVPKVLINTIVANYPDVRFIFLGDREQLSPVNEGQSALISLLEFITFQCKLTEDMRTTCPKQKSFVQDVIDNGWDADFTPATTTRGKIVRQIDQLIETGNRDFVFIGYRHVVVDYWARQIREMLYNKEPGEFYSAGEVVRLSGVVDNDNNEVIRNNEIVTIQAVCPKSNPEFIVVERGNGDSELLELDFNGEIPEAKKVALANRDHKLWAYYYKLLRKYPKISSREAITCHSAQGMTREHVFIDFSDLKREGSKSLLLVGVSRSKNLVRGIW
jgi:ATP-dependent exoDNAse (exonuclease V) alpha subunit